MKRGPEAKTDKRNVTQLIKFDSNIMTAVYGFIFDLLFFTACGGFWMSIARNTMSLSI